MLLASRFSRKKRRTAQGARSPADPWRTQIVTIASSSAISRHSIWGTVSRSRAVINLAPYPCFCHAQSSSVQRAGSLNDVHAMDILNGAGPGVRGRQAVQIFCIGTAIITGWKCHLRKRQRLWGCTPTQNGAQISVGARFEPSSAEPTSDQPQTTPYLRPDSVEQLARHAGTMQALQSRGLPEGMQPGALCRRCATSRRNSRLQVKRQPPFGCLPWHSSQLNGVIAVSTIT